MTSNSYLSLPNKAQYILVKKLASRFKNLCVVGDSDQSIVRP
nr:UvrD-helicase domain-containing protein [Bacillus aquiflavi]